jgi:4-hydroxy-tetrahydrodipicolinate synthase
MPLARPINGIIGACLTPFTKDERINYDALEREIDFIVADCDAISIAAVEAAEYTMISMEDRKELMRRGTEMVGKRIPVILGVSCPSPREVIVLADFAASVGADLIQVLMPLRSWGGQPTIAELMEYYNEIASASPLPVVVYHNPGQARRTGRAGWQGSLFHHYATIVGDFDDGWLRRYDASARDSDRRPGCPGIPRR